MNRTTLSILAATTLVASFLSLGASDAVQATEPCQLLATTAKTSPIDVAATSLDTLARCGSLTGRTLDYAGQKITVPAPGTGWTYSAVRVPGDTGPTEVSVNYYADNTIGVQIVGAGKRSLLGSTSRVAAFRTMNAEAAFPAPETLAAAAVSTKCASTKYSKKTAFMINEYKFYINTGGSYPTGAGSRIKDGAATIIGITNQCGVTADTGIDYNYAGTTTRTAQVPADDGANCSSNDGYSVHSWGALDSPVAATCTFTSGAWVTSADTKYNSAFTWWTDSATTGCSGKYDVQGIATHEIGHAFGLKDLTGTTAASTSQVMYESSGTCRYANRYLGGGDILGLKDIYN